MSCINNQTVTFQGKTRFRYQFEDSKGEIGDWMFARWESFHFILGIKCRSQEHPKPLPWAQGTDRMAT
jgi:hypothetical protein